MSSFNFEFYDIDDYSKQKDSSIRSPENIFILLEGCNYVPVIRCYGNNKFRTGSQIL